MINFHNKVFICKNVNNREELKETIFFYKQNGSMIQAKYFGEKVKYGELIGLLTEQGVIHVSFSHSDMSSEYFGGTATIIPETGGNQQLKLTSKWNWSDGTNTIEELTMEEIN
jgi:hypothetical protein